MIEKEIIKNEKEKNKAIAKENKRKEKIEQDKINNELELKRNRGKIMSTNMFI